MRRDKHEELRRRDWRPWALAALVALAFLEPLVPPVVSVVSGAPVSGVSLDLSLSYLLLAPVCGVLDALTVLSVSQHVAFLGVSVLIFVAWRLFRLRRPSRRHGVVGTLIRESAALVGFLAAMVAVYAVGALVPRPMARLRVEDPDVVVVDFHSHTLSSHDGRRGFTAEDNRAWHRGAGFDVGYVTDHDSIRAGVEAAGRNPTRAGDGTVLLPGREVVYRGMHVTVMGTADPRDRTAPDDPCGSWPLLVGTIPADLSSVPGPECPDGGGGVAAIELVDAAPRGLDQGDRDRARILAIADSMNLAVVASSDNHGWGRTAAGWSLMRIPGWRDMTSRELDASIQAKIRADGRDAVEVVGFRRPDERREGLWAAVVPALLPQGFVVRLSRTERLVWLLWIALAFRLSGRSPGKRRMVSG
jgi:hypothetical protein